MLGPPVAGLARGGFLYFLLVAEFLTLGSTGPGKLVKQNSEGVWVMCSGDRAGN